MTRWLWLLAVMVALAAAGLNHWFRGPRASDPEVSVSSASASTGAGGSPVSRQSASNAARRSDRLRVSVVARYAHDGSAFTQGLLWHGGKLYETTGQYGRSRLRRWNLDTGEIDQETRLRPDLFGEGLALVGPLVGAGSGPPIGPGGGEQLIWLTWKAGRAFRFEADGLASLGEFAYEGEGWGLTLCNGELYRSDGSAILWRHDPETFAVRGRLEVSRDGAALEFLNELECTPRGILANIWQTDEIVRIDSLSGRVSATIDAGGLLGVDERRPEAVLNGIAYRPETDTLLLTGKHWPWLFEVVLEAAGE